MAMAQQRQILLTPDSAFSELPALLGSSRGPAQEGMSGAPGENVSKGAISQLQEFVQGAKLFQMPPNCPVLQWSYDSRMVGMCLEFRATVAFLLDGLPHHIVGTWKHSKKLAQRDAAERALVLFVNRWGEQMVKAAVEPVDPAHLRVIRSRDPVRELYEYSSTAEQTAACAPHWCRRWEGGACQAFVELQLFGVPHTFPGKFCDSEDAACADAARRALWYLQRPGWEEFYEPDPDFAKSVAQAIPEPPTMWARDGNEGEEHQLAERKTAVMRVQNRLQQAYARQLEAGTSVWFWSYERDSKDKGWPSLFRATVQVPLASRTFSGDWIRGQREAQINTCAKIMEFLDAEFPKTR